MSSQPMENRGECSEKRVAVAQYHLQWAFTEGSADVTCETQTQVNQGTFLFSLPPDELRVEKRTHTTLRSITMMSDAQFCVFCQSPGSTSPSRKQESESTVTVSMTAKQTHAEDWQTNWSQVLKLHDNKTHSSKQETQTDNVYFPKACFWLYCEWIFGACFYNENKMLSWSNLF